MNKDDFGSLVPGFLTSWLGHRLIFLIAYAVFAVAILAYSSLFDIKRNLVFYALTLLTICWLLALLWDFFREFSRFGKIWRGQKVTTGTASQLLVKEVDSSPVRHQLETELFKIEQYTGLVLNYLRLQSFHDDLVIESVNLDELVRNLVRKYSLFFIQANTSLDLGQLDRTVKTDKRWLGLLIEQILSNALKYCQEGTISIVLDGDDLVIRDTGIGIAESDLERVFERGFSGFNGRRTQQSSGLGLYLSRKIAAELGYSLKLKSKVGQGTEVRIGIKEVELIFD
ncbi:TPA: sensor histidine kinase [Streptococcus suis]|nr:sensor histidine kinase [Streptococcus suis]NQO39392.1 sensor histidine kinase [Streptococcus suis]NQP22618.1 sensor histidine kinase [Streptococcus suis]NQP24767.1 sensor histidine kinase [Streptococcus suis]HEL1737665.1 sensor histidine kinase [Streptococcus suis]